MSPAASVCSSPVVPVLVVDDDVDHAEIVSRTLTRHDARFDVTHVADGPACLAALAARPYALVLLDYRLPRMTGLEVLAELRRRGVDTPVVMATAEGDERVAVDAMQAGALDYVVKTSGYFTTLPTVVNKVLKQHELARDNERLYREAQTQRARLAQIFDSTSDGIVLLGPRGVVLAANRQAGALLGVDHAALLGEDFAGRLGSGEGTGTPWLAGGDADVTLPATGRTVHVTGQPTRDDTGTPVGLTLTLHDVTREREIDRMKSEFVAFVAHQLRTPLSGMKWMLELARAEQPGSSAADTYLRDAAASIERLIGMVNDLLNISRLEHGTLLVEAAPTDLREVTAAVLTRLEPDIAAKDLTVTVQGAESQVPPVHVGPKLFREVILNLVGNAVKYTPARGTIAIRITADAGEVRWEIRDSGIGIPRTAQDRLFQKFFRAENAYTVDTDGAGLGLYLVRLIVERSGGRICCESEEGCGTAFLISLPAQGEPS